LYGTTSLGGINGSGSIFRIKTDGTGFQTLHSFNKTDGEYVTGGLLINNSTLYGLASQGGDNDEGTLYKINKDGTGFTTLYYFTGTPNSGLVRAGLLLIGNTFYATSNGYGLNGNGTIFKINMDGTGYQNLFNFTSSTTGSNPNSTLVSDGTYLYGTAEFGGQVGIPNSNGVVFKIKLDGTGYTKLVTFNGNSNGRNPRAGLYLDAGTLYGTTVAGGNPDEGTIFKLSTDGTNFQTLYQFNNNATNPYAELISDGTFLYGTTAYGLGSIRGCIFKIKKDGTSFQVLAEINSSNFAPGAESGLCLVNQILYGTTSSTGLNEKGIIYKYNPNCVTTTMTQTLTFNKGDSIKVINKYYNTPGTYKDTTSNALGCDSIITTILSYKSSIISGIDNLEFSVYPNPASNYIKLKHNLLNNFNYSYQMFDIFGRVINEGLITNEIDISKYEKGIYIIKISNNDLVKTVKFVKK
jgi:uncharacterized repeat protein (TIGR03803 family)